MVTPPAKREAVAYILQTHGVSERRACRALGITRALVRYRFTRPLDAALRERLRALAGERRRFGYRRLAILLKREGFVCNIKKVQRLYREEQLMVKRRKGRKKAPEPPGRASYEDARMRRRYTARQTARTS